ncbi:hypothetical protein pgond44_01443 [Psychroflexus gondwanensis ACAM 44]|uniref:Outer membrane protein beta-barrel domain-containing protein n=1 Tax=Psychroflexus gondwanensis ACAM 44 TaxID=1189619 RepID=N1WYZ9_9FLAO|nr:hypothetical protein [Psychroflexus gondwanensis]EMY82324.1 hypothetical protein pgond44_01443 [Psychroflexus gondwanensis ACAM 44]
MNCSKNRKLILNLNSYGWVLCLFLVFTNFSNAQSTKGFEAKQWYVESQIGLSYLWSDLAIVDNSLSLEQEPTFENAIKLQMLFNINYSLARNFFVGFNVGVGYLDYEIKESNQQVNFSNYQFGTYFRYYLEITPMISVFTQVGANQNFLESNRFESNSYINAYNDIGLTLKLVENWWLSFTFRDLVYFYSSDPNFEDRSDFGFSNPLRNFAKFPVFGVQYQLD